MTHQPSEFYTLSDLFKLFLSESESLYFLRFKFYDREIFLIFFFHHISCDLHFPILSEINGDVVSVAASLRSIEFAFIVT